MKQFLQPMAKNTRTKQTVMLQDLTGYRYDLSEESQALAAAQGLADRMSRRSRETWVAVVKTYTAKS